MRDYLKFYINGAWVDLITANTLVVINPATEAVAGRTRWARPPTSTRR